MARQKFFDTDTLDFFELIGNGRRYSVPLYQRDYSWGIDQWEDLWNDILALHEERSERHYMGALVVEEQGDRSLLVIDGQQRLATLSVLAITVIDRVVQLADEEITPEENRERADILRKDFVGLTDPSSLVRSSKLTLNANDNGFYQDTIVQGRDARGVARLSRSNKALEEARAFFRSRLREQGFSSSGAELATFLSETIARGLFFIFITVGDGANAYTIFETLNARGLELTTTDLLKNYLFSQMTPGPALESVQRRWTSLVAQTSQERFPEFLRYHFLVQERKVRKEELFKRVRERVRGPGQALDLLDDLDPRAEVFAALGDPNHPYWEGQGTSRSAVEELKLFGTRQMTPLVFAVAAKLDAATLGSVLRMLSVLSFRYSVVGGLNTNDLEPAYHDAAAAVMKGSATNLRTIFATLNRIYVPDSTFFADFSNWEVTPARRRLAKYVLTRLESETEGRPLDPNTEPGTIEHILPENPDATWEAMISPSEWDRAVYRVGNLTLLETTLNRELGNGNYHLKAQAYARSRYLSTREIAEFAPEEWTVAQIEARQRRQAKLAVHIWRVDA